MAPCFCGSKAMNEELNRLTYEDWTLLYKLVDVHQSSIRLNTKRMHPSIAKSASSRDKGSFLGALTIGAIAIDSPWSWSNWCSVSKYHIISYYISYYIILYHIISYYIILYHIIKYTYIYILYKLVYVYLHCLHFCSWPIKHLGKTKGFIHLGHLSVGLLALTLRLGWRAKSTDLKNLWSAAKMYYICS